jgi:HAD superfamily hydrolase (TIGR01484 family)
MALLATDLDGTVIPPERTPERMEEIRAFRDSLSEADATLAYVTGRHLALALRGLEEFELPVPDFLACDVGTSLYARRGDEYEPVPGYEVEMRGGFGGADGDAVRGLLSGVSGLRAQDRERQGEFKASYLLPWPEPDGLVAEVAERLADAGLKTMLVLSRDPLTGEGLLDVLPEGAAKDRALHHLVDHLDLEAPDVVFAGDSGNDRAALLAGYRAVVVGNAPEALVHDVRASARELGLGDLVYFARARYAAGVVEGCRHHGLFVHAG